MERDPRTFLWDALVSAEAIARYISGKSAQDYLADDMLRAAVERQFEIVGEALNRLAREAPELAARIPNISRAVAFRNLLIHGYGDIDDPTVFRIATEDPPALTTAVRQVFGDLEPRSK
ncbi:MAG TPA: HepT-like ribonuclease domain-containing protein [Caulobacteraceae bacterium]|nr:HepT-like ribonuclease domain-containing protein [Caulobacteraceae bacterium]